MRKEKGFSAQCQHELQEEEHLRSVIRLAFIWQSHLTELGVLRFAPQILSFETALWGWVFLKAFL